MKAGQRVFFGGVRGRRNDSSAKKKGEKKEVGEKWTIKIKNVLSCFVLSRPCVQPVRLRAGGRDLTFTSARVLVRGPLSPRSVLSRPLWPCYRLMCVIATETGLSP